MRNKISEANKMRCKMQFQRKLILLLTQNELVIPIFRHKKVTYVEYEGYYSLGNNALII